MDVDDNIFNNSGNDIDITCYSLLNAEKEFIYDGKVNIWVNKKNIALFPEYRDDINAVNILKSKPGYCIVSRSKLFKDVPLEVCQNIAGEKIMESSLNSYSVGDIILAKLPGWKSFVPCTIKSFYDKNKNLAFKKATLNLLFISCPESDFTIAWNYSRNIVPNKSVISYTDMRSEKLNDRTIQNNLSYCDAPFLVDTYEQNLYENTIITNSTNHTNNIFTGLIDKNENNEHKQILKYNLSWIKPYFSFTSRNIFGKKGITVASSSFSKSITKDFLPNVRVLEPEQFNNIFKIQQNTVGLMKVISKNQSTFPNQDYYCNIEPQNIKQFKGNVHAAAYYLERNNYITYTGNLSQDARKYLLNI